MDHINRLAKYFGEFPGIGDRQSKRFVYFLLSQNPEYLKDISNLIMSLKKNISRCDICYRFFPSPNESVCDVCVNIETDTSFLMIVEKDADYENIRKSKIYSGRYFILGGLVPIVEKDTSKRIRVRELENAINAQIKEYQLKEIIVALSLNPHGEHTDMYLREILSPFVEKHGVKITSLGRGLSTGTELEYSDNDTIKNALKNRN